MEEESLMSKYNSGWRRYLAGGYILFWWWCVKSDSEIRRDIGQIAAPLPAAGTLRTRGPGPQIKPSSSSSVLVATILAFSNCDIDINRYLQYSGMIVCKTINDRRFDLIEISKMDKHPNFRRRNHALTYNSVLIDSLLYNSACRHLLWIFCIYIAVESTIVNSCHCTVAVGVGVAIAVAVEHK